MSSNAIASRRLHPSADKDPAEARGHRTSCRAAGRSHRPSCRQSRGLPNPFLDGVAELHTACGVQGDDLEYRRGRDAGRGGCRVRRCRGESPPRLRARLGSTINRPNPHVRIEQHESRLGPAIRRDSRWRDRIDGRSYRSTELAIEPMSETGSIASIGTSLATGRPCRVTTNSVRAP